MVELLLMFPDHLCCVVSYFSQEVSHGEILTSHWTSNILLSLSFSDIFPSFLPFNDILLDCIHRCGLPLVCIHCGVVHLGPVMHESYVTHGNIAGQPQPSSDLLPPRCLACKVSLPG